MKTSWNTLFARRINGSGIVRMQRYNDGMLQSMFIDDLIAIDAGRRFGRKLRQRKYYVI